MNKHLRQGWVVLTLVLGTMAYAIAADVTLTTYYPSPRGVYQELRTSGDLHVGALGAATARLHVTQTAAANALLVEDQAADASPFVVDQNGNVGIGVSAPTLPLDVLGSSRIRATSGLTELFVDNATAANADAQLRLRTETAQDWVVGIDRSDSSKFKIANSTALGTNDRVTIQPSGSVGIGISAPTERLHVSGGNLRVDGTVTVTGAAALGATTVTGTVAIQGGTPAAGQVLTSSDAAGNATWEPVTAVYAP